MILCLNIFYYKFKKKITSLKIELRLNIVTLFEIAVFNKIFIFF